MSRQPAKPFKNLLMIVADDLRPELNCFGKRKLRTPHLDRLAARSLRYDRAYCQFPQCMPSRTSALTGRRPQGYCEWSDQLCAPGQPTFPAALRASGRRTMSIGKVYHEPLDDRVSWDDLDLSTAQPNHTGGMSHGFHDYQSPEWRRWRQGPPAEGGDGPWWTWPAHRLPPLCESWDAPDDAYIDGRSAGLAIDRLERMAGRAGGWFLAVGFMRPHLPWAVPRRYWDLYRRDEVDLADNPFFPIDGVGTSNLGDLLHYGDPEVRSLYRDIGRYHDDSFPVLDEAKQRECVHGYWASVSFLDAQVGRVLDALERLGQAEDTVVMLWGDNGWHLGEHKLWSKVTHFDESTRVPLMLAAPGITSGGLHRGIVELVDLYPTACDLLGIPRPAHLDGEALPLGPESPGKEAATSVCWNGRTVVTERYRFTRYHSDADLVIPCRGRRELFDLQADRRENRNVADDPRHAATVSDLEDLLRRRYGDLDSRRNHPGPAPRA